MLSLISCPLPTFRCRPARLGAAAPAAWALLALLVFLLAGSTPLAAQDEEDQVIPWEYRPYQVRLYVAFGHSPWYSPARRRALLRSFQQQSFREGGSAWEVTALEIPTELAGYVAGGVEGLSLEQLMAFDSTLVDEYDKLIFLHLTEHNLEFRAAARELDGRTRYWGPIRRRSAVQPELIASQAYDAVLDCFAPLLRVGRILEDGTVDCSLRAGYLITQTSSPAQVHQHDVLLPITRHNGRDGQPRKDGIVPSPWTFLSVRSAEGGKVVCDIHSGVRNSIGSRSSRRKERLALTIKLEGQPTELVLRTGGKEPEPLVGYEIHSKYPLSDSSFELLGRTNWAGEISIPPGESPLRVLYVKNGDRVLNRLPMMPGLQPQLVAELPDDSRRLEAEGFASGIQAQLMDLVALRALYAATIKRELDQGTIEKAEEQFAKYRELPSPASLTVQLEQEHRRIVASTNDTRLRGRIDAVFSNVTNLVTTLIDPGEEGRLAAEIAAAKGGNRPPPTTPATPSTPVEQSGSGTPDSGTPGSGSGDPVTPPAETTPPANEDDPFGGFGSGAAESSPASPFEEVPAEGAAGNEDNEENPFESVNPDGA